MREKEEMRVGSRLGLNLAQPANEASQLKPKLQGKPWPGLPCFLNMANITRTSIAMFLVSMHKYLKSNS